MKPKPNLTIDSRKARLERKYAGDPDSPNFMPPSPLIDRQILPPQVEWELKRVCLSALAKEQSADEDLAVIARYMSSKPQRSDSKLQKHDKHSSFTFEPPKPYVPEVAASSFLTSTGRLPSKIQTQEKRTRHEVPPTIVFESLEPENKKPYKQKPSFTNADDEALHQIRTKLDSRPKTSAAACIDYTDSTSPGHSNRTTSVPSNRTTYSTPFTSAGITPAQTSKRFSQSVPNAMGTFESEPIETSALPKFPDDATALDAGQAAQARAWMAEQLARRRRSSTQTPYEASTNRSVREFSSSQVRLGSENTRPPSRAGSIRNSIREYIRPGSCSPSIQSNRSTTSTRERTRHRFSSLKAKISNASLRSRASSRRRPGYDDGEEYFIDPDQVDLDRPLPPLPGLDSYKEKPKHIGLMMKSLMPSSHHKRDTKSVIIDNDGVERLMTTDQEKRRQDDLARAVLEKMHSGSIGSVPGSPTGVITVYREGSGNSIGSVRGRPITAGSGGAVGAVPIYNTYQNPGLKPLEEMAPSSQPASPRPINGFVKKWGERLGWGRKPRPLAIT